MTRWNAKAVLALLLVAFVAGSCERGTDIGDPPPFVTIAGIVRGPDTGVPTRGIRVRLYGTNFMDDSATRSDGRYSLRVPLGSKLALLTEDFDPTTADVWFPVINVDLPARTADRDLLDWPIFALPQTRCPNDSDGAVAIWDNYLRNTDARTGDRFVPSSCAESGGILAISFMAVNDTVFSSLDSMSVGTGTAAFPTGCVDSSHLLEDDLCSDLAPSLFFPSTRDHGDFFLSFGDPAYRAPSVTLQVSDLSVGRLPFATPVEVPVAPGTITFLIAGAIDGVPNRSFRELACAAGLFTCAP